MGNHMLYHLLNRKYKSFLYTKQKIMEFIKLKKKREKVKNKM